MLAVKDEVREEEVLACIVTRSGRSDAALAEELFAFCNKFVNDKLGLDLAAHVQPAGVQLPQSHL
mgnify:CR=1 FL=1